MPSRSRTNGARRPYLRSGFHTAKKAAAAIMERALDGSVPDADLDPDELDTRKWIGRVVRHIGRRRMTPFIEDLILVAGEMRYVVFTTAKTVHNKAKRDQLVNKKESYFRPLTGDWFNYARRFLAEAEKLDLPPELEDGPELGKFIRDPTKPWNKRGKALDAASQAPAATRPADTSVGGLNHQDASPERPQGAAGPQEEQRWSV